MIIRTYPSLIGEIHSLRSLRQRMERVMEGMNIPEISVTCREMGDLTAFVPVLSPLCTSVWEDVTGSPPSFNMEEALKTAALGKGIAGIDINDADGDILQAIMNNAFSQFLNLLREKNAHLIPDPWTQGECPFCGATPRIGFDSDDKRVLHCLSCGQSWRFPRLRCPSCNNCDYNTQGYFEVDGVEGARVSFCRECNRYIKVIDTSVRTMEDPETADALTLELDDLAAKEGFVMGSDLYC